MNPSQIIPFNFESSKIRVVTVNDEPWFVGSDVAKALGYAKPENALSRHCKASSTTPKQGGGYLTIIPERDVYRLIMRSKLPAAEQFEEWVVGEVLPTIRKTGGAYLTEQKAEEIISNPETIIKVARQVIELRAVNAKQEELLQEQAPKVLFADAVATSDTSILVGELAKLIKQNGYDIGGNRLFKWLREEGFLIKRKGADWNTPTQYAADLALLETKERTVNNPDGSVRIVKTPKVTGKGQQYFINKFLKKLAA